MRDIHFFLVAVLEDCTFVTGVSEWVNKLLVESRRYIVIHLFGIDF